MSTVKQIGLLIDAFDPPHAGHLRVAEKMLKNKADEVWPDSASFWRFL